MITKKFFGNTSGGGQVFSYELKNGKGESAAVLEYGAAVQFLKVKNKYGGLTDVVLGYDDISAYENNACYMGALIGRYANRIAGGEFTLNGKKYTLYKNDGNNHLHGGKRGYDKRIWKARICGEKLCLTLHSPDNEEGYPSAVSIEVAYSFDEESSFNIEYHAVSDGDTIINLTSHCYFNLNGQRDVLSHKMKIYSDYFTPADAGSIPTGEIKSVKGTPFDFTMTKTIGRDIDAADLQLIQAKGYDHNYVLKQGYKKACEVYAEESGILMEVFTDSPGMQFYSGNYLNGIRGKGGNIYEKRNGFCLETQLWPDSPNKPQFPSCVLKKGEEYRHKTAYKFNVDNFFI
jgi:aldose 1-epimerase